MALQIETFSNTTGGSSFFKAVGHPLAAPLCAELVARLKAAGPVAVYDPMGHLSTFAALHDLSGIELAGVFVQDVEKIGATALGRTTEPVTALPRSGARTLFIAAFDADRLLAQIRTLVPAGTEVVSLDAARLPDEMVSDKRNYLAGINFATNFAFFRDADGQHTRIVTANYWSAYGARSPRMWCRLFDADGRELATWEDPLPAANATIRIDSAEIRRRFDLPPFTGQLFVHVQGAAGHDVVKYALDTYGDEDTVLSCTHDANAWPSDLYAGVPAPKADETVVLWVQNSHPCPIPKGGVALNRMGEGPPVPLDREIPPFATYRLDVAELLPDVAWPAQIEVHAGRHMVRPRYEVFARHGRQRIAHPNVQRIDLKPDPKLPELGGLLGKGFILPAPVFDPARFRTWVLPTPMSTAQTHLPVQCAVFDANGREVARHRFGNLPRNHASAVEVGALLAEAGVQLGTPNGHLELTYDFAAGPVADGWLHALFRYEDTASGHAAETSFGSHVFNTALTYRNEPQSYAGRPPGLTTRLFLRLGPARYDSLCHLIYPASTPWHPASDTVFLLMDGTGQEVARRSYAIPCGGSLHFRYHAEFTEAERAKAGANGYILIRDTTCRLFGYHGLICGETAFSLDHMFGF